jgi:PAS domain S-box-containing protein
MRIDVDKLIDVFDVLDAGILIVSSKHEILEINQKACELLSLPNANKAKPKIPSKEWFTLGEHGPISTSEGIPVNKVFETGIHMNDVLLGLRQNTNDPVTWLNINIAPLSVNRTEGLSLALITITDVAGKKGNNLNISQFSKMAEQIPLSILIADTKGFILYATPFFYKISSWNHSDVIGQHMQKVCKIKPGQFNSIWKDIQSKKVWQGILPTENNNKKVTWNHITIAPTLDKDNEIINYVISLLDVSELKQTQNDLENEKALLKAVIDNLPDAIFVKDRELKKILTNKADLQNIGLTEEEILGKTDYEVFPEEIARNFILDDLKVITNEEPIINHKETVVDTSGNIRILSTSKVPLKDKEGKTIGLIGIGHDITQRTEYEKNLSITQHGIDHANIAIFRIEENGNISYSNHFACNLLGYTQEELTCLTIFDIDPNFSKKGWVFHRSNPYGLNSSTIISKHKRKDHSFFPVEVTITYFLFEDQFYSYSFSNDITEREKIRKELEKKNRAFSAVNEDFLEQNKELTKSLEYITQINMELEVALKRAEESDKLKSAFLANLSHEIRTPMNGILGFIELLKQQLLTEDPNLSYMDIIQNSGKRLVNVISEIIDISRIHTRQIDVIYSKTDLNNLLERLVLMFLPESQHKKIKINFTKKYEVLEIQTDEEKLEAAFSKILNNAIKFTEKGSIDIITRKTKNHIMLYFKDTGIGIDSGMEEKVFEIFRQGDYEISRRFEGTGIGLSIAKAYIELLGGTLNYKSKKNVGTTFIVKLPIGKNHAFSGSSKPEIQNSGNVSIKGKKILAIDNESDLINYLQITFNFYEALFFIADNYVDALKIIKNNNGIDLILINVTADGIDGIQIIKDIHRDYPEIRLAALTKAGSHIIKKVVINAGCPTVIQENSRRGIIVEIIKQELLQLQA